jgi:vitamin B12 transporter
MNKKIKFGLAGAVLLSTTISSVAAQEIDEIVVSATGIPTPLAQIGSSVDVITAEDLERQQITYLQDALKLKGINVPQNGGPGTLSNVFLRGLPGRYTDLVVDGISMFDPGSNQVLWNDVVTDSVGQVEILRGSQGVLYGSNTITGVVSQFTAIGGETKNRVRLETGEFSTQRLTLSGKGDVGSTDFGYAVSRIETDGFSAAKTEAGNDEDDGYENVLLNGRTVTHFGDAVSLELVLRAAEGEVDTDAGSGSDEVGKSSAFERQAFRVGLQTVTGAWQHKFGMTSYDGEIDDKTNFAVTGQRKATRDSLDYRGAYSLSENMMIVVGAESRQAEFENTDEGFSNFARHDVELKATYGLVQYMSDDGLSLTAALRQDDHQFFGKHDTYRATVAYELSETFALRVAHGTGFRAPSLNELYSASAGNTNLKPETSESLDIGFYIQVVPSVDVSLTAFDISVEDRIDWVGAPTAENPFAGQNQQIAGTSQSKGIEVNLLGDISSSISWEFDATYIDSNTEPQSGSATRQIRVPRSQYGFTVDYAANERLQMAASLRHVKGSLDTDFSSFPYVDVELDDYTLLNLNASYQVNDRVKAYGRVENATDEDYETVLGYNTPGRAFYFGVSSSF